MKNSAFNPRNLLLAMTSGLVAAAVYIPMAISLAALIFAGDRRQTWHRESACSWTVRCFFRRLSP